MANRRHLTIIGEAQYEPVGFTPQALTDITSH